MFEHMGNAHIVALFLGSIAELSVVLCNVGNAEEACKLAATFEQVKGTEKAPTHCKLDIQNMCELVRSDVVF